MTDKNTVVETVNLTYNKCPAGVPLKRNGSVPHATIFYHASRLLLQVTIMASFNPYSSPANNSEKTPINLKSNMYARSTPKPDLDPGTIAFVNGSGVAIVQAATLTTTQKVSAMKQTFQNALGNVAANRKIIYDLLVDLKEHFHEYGFKSAAAAVAEICKRSKAWANKFMAEIEAELQIYGELVDTTLAAEADRQEKKELTCLKRIERAREEEPEKPHIKTRDEILEEQKPAPRKATENGKPKTDLAVWSKGMDCGGAFLRAVDEINRSCPNKYFHDRAISEIQGVMRLIDTWRTKGC